MFYEMMIEKNFSTGLNTRMIWIEENSTFEQLHQQVLEAFKEDSPRNHSFRIIRSNGKKQSGTTIQQQSFTDQAATDPFHYNDASESTHLFEDCLYEKDVVLKSYFKKTGDSAAYTSVQDSPNEYTLTLNKILSPAATILAQLNQIVDLSPERGESYDNLKEQLNSLTQLLGTSAEKTKTATSGPKPTQLYSFKITLEDVGVPVWRKVQVLSNSTFLELHKIIQILFDWQDEHLHDFTIQKSNGIRQKNVIIESADSDPTFANFFFKDEQTSYKEEEEHLHDHFLVEKDQARYTYDFGDDWRHKIVLEKILEPAEGMVYPVCTAAKNDAPYEDSRHEVLHGELSLLNSNAKAIVADVNAELARRMHHKKMSRKKK